MLLSFCLPHHYRAPEPVPSGPSVPASLAPPHLSPDHRSAISVGGGGLTPVGGSLQGREGTATRGCDRILTRPWELGQAFLLVFLTHNRGIFIPNQQLGGGGCEDYRDCAYKRCRTVPGL